MTNEQTLSQATQLEADAEVLLSRARALRQEVAEAECPYKVGDIVVSVKAANPIRFGVVAIGIGSEHWQSGDLPYAVYARALRKDNSFHQGHKADWLYLSTQQYRIVGHVEAAKVEAVNG